jgi:hypothetical protein
MTDSLAPYRGFTVTRTLDHLSRPQLNATPGALALHAHPGLVPIAARSREDLEAVIDAMIERYGNPPPNVHYIDKRKPRTES